MKLDQPSKEICRLVDSRDSYRCVRCGVSLYQVNGARHHRKPRSHAFGVEKHSPMNLILLCTGCHGWVHAHPAEAYEHGWMVHGWDSPSDVPVDSALNGRILLNDDGTYEEIGQ